MEQMDVLGMIRGLMESPMGNQISQQFNDEMEHRFPEVKTSLELGFIYSKFHELNEEVKGPEKVDEALVKIQMDIRDTVYLIIESSTLPESAKPLLRARADDMMGISSPEADSMKTGHDNGDCETCAHKDLCESIHKRVNQ